MIVSVTSLVAAMALLVAPSAFAFGDEKHGGHHGPRNHHELSEHVERANLTERGYSYTGVRATWYNLGMTACGQSYSDSDFVVALSQSTFGWSYPSSYCNKAVTISYGGKTAQAKIVDSCVACSNYGSWCLDLSVGLFTYFADVGLGVIDVDWSFNDGSSGGGGGDDDTPKTTSTKHTTSTHHTTSTRHTTSTQHTTTTHTTPTTTSHHTTSTKETTSTTSKISTSTTTKHSSTSTSKTSSALPSTTSSSTDPSATGNFATSMM